MKLIVPAIFFVQEMLAVGLLMLGRRPRGLMLMPIISFWIELSFAFTAGAIHIFMSALIGCLERTGLSFFCTVAILKSVGLHIGLLDIIVSLWFCESLGLREGVGAFGWGFVKDVVHVVGVGVGIH